MYSACIEIVGEEGLETVYRALQPESKGGARYKSKVSVGIESDMVKICIESPTLSSLRASLNTFLRLLSTIVEASNLQ